MEQSNNPQPPQFQPQPPQPAPQPVMVPAEPATPPQAPTQPQYTPQPQPVFTPQPFAAPASVAQPGQTKPKIGLLIGAIVGAAVLIAAVLAGLIFLSGPSRDDYKQSATTANDAISAYNSMSAIYISTSSTETEIKNDLDALKTNRIKFDTKFTELAKQKAVSRDADVDKLYAAATDKKVKFDKALNAEIEAYEKILPLVTKMDSSPSDVTAYTSMISTLRGSLQTLELNEQVNKDYITALVRDLKTIEGLLPTIVAGKADYRKYDSKATNDFYDTLDSLNDDDRDWKSNMEKLQADGELRDELNKLEESLFTKSAA